MDLISEKSVLVGIIQYGKDGWVDVSDIIDADCFGDDFNASLYKCLDYLCQDDHKIDLPSILSAANSLKLQNIQDTDNRTYLKSLFNTHIELENVRKFAGKLRKLKIANDLQLYLCQAQAELKGVTGDESLDHILNIAEDKIFEFSNNLGLSKDNEPEHIGNNLDDYLERLSTCPVDQVGIPTGYKYYDLAIGGGLRRGGFNLIAARIKAGKSTFADNVGINTGIKLGIPTLILDTEMAINDHWNRIISNQTNIIVDNIENGAFSKDLNDTALVQECQGKLKQSKLYYKNISGKKFSEVISLIRRWIYKHVGLEGGRAKDCVVIYDYFKLPESEAKDTKYQEYQLMGFQSAKLHDFAHKYGVAVLAFVQLNRDGIDKEHTGTISQSDRLLWNCSSCSIFKQKSIEEMNEDGIHMGNRKLVPLVSRYGKEWDLENYINMEMKGEYAQIIELGTRDYTDDQTIDFS